MNWRVVFLPQPHSLVNCILYPVSPSERRSAGRAVSCILYPVSCILYHVSLTPIDVP